MMDLETLIWNTSHAKLWLGTWGNYHWCIVGFRWWLSVSCRVWEMSAMMFGHGDLGFWSRFVMIGFREIVWKPLNCNTDAVLRLVWGNPWRVVNSNFWGGAVEFLFPKNLKECWLYFWKWFLIWVTSTKEMCLGNFYRLLKESGFLRVCQLVSTNSLDSKNEESFDWL